MSRHAHEFQCDGQGSWKTGKENCGWFNYPMLRDNMNGNYVIVCGKCGHKHYRVIKDGVVTSDRHNVNEPIAEVIHCLPSQTSETRREAGELLQFRRMEMAGRAT